MKRVYPKPMRRFIAGALDWLFIIFACALILFVPIMNVIREYVEGSTASESYLWIMALIVVIVVVFVAILYFSIVTYFLNGQSLGKKFFGIKVIMFDGSRPNFLTCLLRSSLQMIIFVFSFGLSMIADLVTLLLGKEHNCFYEAYSHTCVIEI